MYFLYLLCYIISAIYILILFIKGIVCGGGKRLGANEQG